MSKKVVVNEAERYPVPQSPSKRVMAGPVGHNLLRHTMNRRHLVFVMVGLPARGKTYIARKISRYLNWMGVNTKVFNVGNYRREYLGSKQDPKFFDPDNVDGWRARKHMAVLCLDELFEWLDSGGMVAIYDATNTTKERRRLIRLRAEDENVDIVYIESVCEDEQLIDSNIRATKQHSPDFEGLCEAEAIGKFKERIAMYEKAYEPVSADEADSVSYIRMYDVGKRLEVNNLPHGYIPSRVVFYVMNIHITTRPIWLSRHGQSEFNEEGRIGGDSTLTEMGESYAQALGDWIMERTHGEDSELPSVDLKSFSVMTSTLQRTRLTAQYIPKTKINLRILDEIAAGVMDGLTYEEIKERYPEEYAARQESKLTYRYPQGESYEDVIARLEPVIFELERSRKPVLVIAHNAVLRCLYGYFTDVSLNECPYIDIPLHAVIELTPKAYGCKVARHQLIPESPS